MRKPILMILVLLIGCVEPYQFTINEGTPPLVIESYISNSSFNNCLQYPSDGRFFKTVLRYGQRIHGFGEYVNGATVTLISDQNESWPYTEVRDGNYELRDLNFAAEYGKRYKLNILLPSNQVIESSWESLPSGENSMGDLYFKESSEYRTYREEDETIVDEIYGIDLIVDIPRLEHPQKTYFKWQYETSWIYLALKRENGHPLYQCWVNGNNSYLTNYSISESDFGGHAEKLKFIPIESNERVWYKLSLLVKQFEISKNYYDFLNELNSQSESSDLFATPPYNLSTNYKSVNDDIKVFGYFSVRAEVAKRMYFSIEDTSYKISDSDRYTACNTGGPVPAPDDPCLNCLFYDAGVPSLFKPWWWADN